jgi:hypothetical protein
MKDLTIIATIAFMYLSSIAQSNEKAFFIASDTIVNKGETSEKFYLKYSKNNNELKAHILHSDSVFYTWLISQGTSKSADERRLQYVQSLISLTKQLLYGTNSLNNLAADVEEANKKLIYSPVINFLSGGIVSPAKFVVNTLCNLAERDTACNKKNFRIAQHDFYSLIEFRYQNSWAAADPNPLSHAMLFAKSKAGYHSVEELSADTSLIQKSIQLYYQTNKTESAPDYPDWVYSSIEYTKVFKIQKFETKEITTAIITDQSGVFSLPPNAALIFTNQPNIIYINKQTANGGKLWDELIDLYHKFVVSEKESILEKIISKLANYSGVSQEKVKEIVALGNVFPINDENCLNTRAKIDTYPYHYFCQLVLSKTGKNEVAQIPLIKLEDDFSLWTGKDNKLNPPTSLKLLQTTPAEKAKNEYVFKAIASTILLNPGCFAEIEPINRNSKLQLVKSKR